MCLLQRATFVFLFISFRGDGIKNVESKCIISGKDEGRANKFHISVLFPREKGNPYLFLDEIPGGSGSG